MLARNRRLALLAPLVALPLVLTACEFNVDTDDADTKSKTVSYDVGNQGVRTIKVDSDAGNVKVIESDTKAIQVKEKQHYNKTQPTTSHETKGDVLDLAYDCGDKKACFVAYEVTVPRGGIGLKIDTGAGNVTLRDISGAIDVKTSAGKVDGKGIRSATLKARTSAGSIDVAFAQPPGDADAETDAGRATIRVPAGQQYKADVSADIGDTDVKIDRNDQSKHKVRVHTTAGQARLLNT